MEANGVEGSKHVALMRPGAKEEGLRRHASEEQPVEEDDGTGIFELDVVGPRIIQQQLGRRVGHFSEEESVNGDEILGVEVEVVGVPGAGDGAEKGQMGRGGDSTLAACVRVACV